MKEDRVRRLNDQVKWISEKFCDVRDLAGGKRGEPGEFKKVIKVQPISDSGAIAIFEKASTGKRAVALFLWLEREGKFSWWFPSDSDLLFLNRAQAYREAVEGFNAGLIREREERGS